MSDAQTLAVYDAKAGDYAKMVSSSAPDADLTRFMALLKPGARVLDLGCGPGHASAHMRAEGFEPDPVDASAEMVALANKTYKINARQATFDQITPTRNYDGIWANFSLLHAPRGDVQGHIHTCVSALHPQGIFHIGMKTGRGESRDTIGRRYCYFPTSELTAMLSTAGLRVLTRREGAEAGLSGEIAPFVILQAIKHA